MKGEFVYAALEAGWRAEGVEFAGSIPNLFNVPIRYGEFLDMEFAPAKFDCVTMWAALEHVYEPRAYVRRIAQLLADGGTFLGVVTNFNSLQARFLRADDYPRHLTLFTKSSMRKLLGEAGLEPVRFWTDRRLFGGALQTHARVPSPDPKCLGDQGKDRTEGGSFMEFFRILFFDVRPQMVAA